MNTVTLAVLTLAIIFMVAPTNGNILGVAPVTGIATILTDMSKDYPLLGIISPLITSFVQNLYNCMNNISLALQILSPDVKNIIGCNLSLLLATMTEIYSSIIFYINVLLESNKYIASAADNEAMNVILGPLCKKAMDYLSTVEDSDDKLLAGVIDALTEINKL